MPDPLRRAAHVPNLPAETVSDGILRKRIHHSPGFADAWQIEFAPGTVWPFTDHHSHEEWYYVMSGELIEGQERYPAGSYLRFLPGSSHRPRSEIGAVIIGVSESPAHS